MADTNQPRWLTPGVTGIGGASLLADLRHEIPISLLPSLMKRQRRCCDCPPPSAHGQDPLADTMQVLTSDDGYPDVREVASPHLRERMPPIVPY